MAQRLITRGFDRKRLLACTLLAGVTGIWPAAAFAQDASDQDDDEVIVTEGEDVAVIEDAEDAEDLRETIVVTGSRIQRSTFTSVKPVQIITGDISRDIGMVDAASLIQESSASSGLQTDTTFNGFVLDNGPGASTADLRGLASSRTLVLLNGRRLGASGVGGAPSSPSLDVLPSIAIDRYEVLLDGASSVYGSDAVAGVVNAILRTDFSGFEVEGSLTVPELGGGGSQYAAATWGVSNDRGFLGFSMEWTRSENVKLNDRPDHLGRCATSYEVTPDGEIRTAPLGLIDPKTEPGVTIPSCSLSFGINRIWLDPLPGRETIHFGSLYYTPGRTNVGIPDYSDNSLLGVRPFLDADGNLEVDIFAPYYQQIGYPQERVWDARPKTENFSFFGHGEHSLGGAFNTAAFFEVLYTNRQVVSRGEQSRAFSVTVPAANPFNICNPDGVRGVNCGQSLQDLVVKYFRRPLSAFGHKTPVMGSRLLRQEARLNLRPGDELTTVNTDFTRFLGGLKGDVPLADYGLNDWTWEVSASYDRSSSQLRGSYFSNDRLALSLLTTVPDPNNPGNFICGLDVNEDGVPDSKVPFPSGGTNKAPLCVPIDVFSPTLYGLGGGNLATEAEYDYLISRATFNTVVEQTLFQGFVTGTLYELPYGSLKGVFGVEYREDSVESLPDDVYGRGLRFGYNSDRGATGTRDLLEAFVEVEAPIIADKAYAKELLVQASARWTEESGFGSAWTYSLGGSYRPSEFLTFRASHGTSFRAPNLREQFLIGTSGFRAVSDPCIVSERYYKKDDPKDPGDGEYRRELDPRSEQLLKNCRDAGVDPLKLGLRTSPGSPELFTTGGTDDLGEETSSSWTGGFVFEQPFFNDFDATFALTYYDIEVSDTLVTWSAQYVINDCYSDDEPLSESALCGLVRRDPVTGFITEVDQPYGNQDAEIARGMDFNFLYEQEITVGRQEMSIGVDIDANYTIDRITTVRAPGSDPVSNRQDGEIYYPEWRGRLRAFADYDDFRLTYNLNWVGEEREYAQDSFFVIATNGERVTGTTCRGINRGDNDCRDVDYTDDHFIHSLSLRYERDTWNMVVGVRNLFDQKPRRFDPQESFERLNTNVRFGDDFIGRRVFVSMKKSF